VGFVGEKGRKGLGGVSRRPINDASRIAIFATFSRRIPHIDDVHLVISSSLRRPAPSMQPRLAALPRWLAVHGRGAS